MDQILKKYPKINLLNVSRETCLDFEKYISMILEKNKEINIVSKINSSTEEIMNRHIIDSAQVYDFINLNDNTTVDIGSGGGFSGIVIAIIAKYSKINQKFNYMKKATTKAHF